MCGNCAGGGRSAGFGSFPDCDSCPRCAGCAVVMILPFVGIGLVVGILLV